MYVSVYVHHVHVCESGAHEKTRGKERTTPTQLIKIAKDRHLAGVTIFILSLFATPNM